jgi:transcription elongation factor Elf1
MPAVHSPRWRDKRRIGALEIISDQRRSVGLLDSMGSTDAHFPERNRLMTDVPVIIKLPFPCPHCGKEASDEAGRLMTNRQALCGSCGGTIDLAGEQMIAVLDKITEALSRAENGR